MNGRTRGEPRRVKIDGEAYVRIEDMPPPSRLPAAGGVPIITGVDTETGEESELYRVKDIIEWYAKGMAGEPGAMAAATLLMRLLQEFEKRGQLGE